jgi:hypothetical protein
MKTLLFSVVLVAALPAISQFPQFEFHKIGEYGMRMGQTAMVDLDVVEAECDTSDTRVFWWENSTGDAKNWIKHVILENFRCHEAKAADVDGDGDVDICAKPWNGNIHVFLENKLTD